MFQVSNDASSELAGVLEGLAPPDGYCLRIGVRNRDLYFALDMPRSGDRQFVHQEEVILVVDPETLDACAGYVLDFDDGDFWIRQAVERN